MVIPNCLQQYRQRTLRDLLLLELSNLSFIKFRLRDIGQITTEIGVRREIVPEKTPVPHSFGTSIDDLLYIVDVE